ncbi:mediator of RNA polymerase II transcription subunit 1-like [Hyperolius riggenbachi]|uniref:mediator of RNA polymerase II transcription subunit 1-like n=1 Tax=Hyperolius riggenbachi TaxID=752182 RepID=UPI0035A368B3
MFYIEVQAKKNGQVASVKLAHHGESPTVCTELLMLLRAKDFEAFGKSLDGLLKLYNISGSSEIKAKVYLALCNLEADLSAVYNLNRPTTDEEKLTAILCGEVGILSPRCGGTPMNIEYYISPCQVLEEKLKPGTRVVGKSLSVTAIGTKNLYRLPMCSLFQQIPEESGSMYRFSTITEESSMMLPACFSLTLEHLEPVLFPLIHKIQSITGLPLVATDYAPFHELIIDAKSQQLRIPPGRHYIVSLPDCVDHCYVLNSGPVFGKLVYKIPFTHPDQVLSILEIMRHQVAYNTLLYSCISSAVNPKDHTRVLHFEVSLQTDFKICISFQHPSGSSLSCVVADILNSRKLMCSVYTGSSDPPSPCNSEFLTKALERCMSIPITMRSIYKKVQRDFFQKREPSDSQNDGELSSHDLSDDLSNSANDKQVDSFILEKSVGFCSAYDPNEELFPDTDNINSVDPQEQSLCPQENNSSFTEDVCSNITDVEEPHSSLAEESYSSFAEEPNSSIVQELSPIMASVPSSNLAEDLSSSITEELSSSTAEEINQNVLGHAMSQSVEECEMDESY